MKSQDKIILQTETSLSKSNLWQYQRDFYNHEGINAWTKVPYYISSNPYIANSYANIIIRFFQDCIYQNIYNPSKPIYILELGAGSGTFSFYVIKRLLELQRALNLTQVKFVYIMTDFAEKNIQYWEKHSAFQNYIQSGILDFARFEVGKDTEINLIRSGQVLSTYSEHQLHNPLIVLANYIFDSVPQDIFRVSEGKLKVGLATVSTIQDNVKDNQPIEQEKLEVVFSYEDISIPYYQDEYLDKVLSYYREQIEEGYLLFPIGSLRGIRHLMDISNQKLCLISSDLGFSKYGDLYQREEPCCIFNGSFYMMLDFRIIAQYFQHWGGDYYHQFAQQSLNTSIFLLGFNFQTMPETRQAVETFLDAFGHATFYNIYEHIERTKPFSKLEMLLTFLSTTHCDPHVFDSSIDIIIEQIRSGYASILILKDLMSIMDKIAENFYFKPYSIDTLFNIGVFFLEIREYEKALHYFHQSIHYFGENEITLYNMGLCYYFLGEIERALEKFWLAIKINPIYIMARGWISQIEAEKAEEEFVSLNAT